MTVASDAALLLAHLDSIGVHGRDRVEKGWDHMGANLVDAALQRRQDYGKVVRKRARVLKEAWPDAKTTSGFLDRLATDDLSAVISWSGPDRLKQIADMAEVLKDKRIEEPGDLRAALEDPDRKVELRGALQAIRYVGPKTLDYFDILAGLSTGVAVDRRLLRITDAAGIGRTGYDYVAEVIREAADVRGWRHGDLDAAMWAYVGVQSAKTKGRRRRGTAGSC
ncbi:hypothetical protein [Arthrobacter mobilis]|uniref:Uncharacterized protein n=1 Tax=Arthrobacter mobilis TaxID=2724944 RepID=A0A7X6K6Y8_9MICC|nr:hypothetical protein [Arthrobacter mobilis]NKX55958.1 hypothetical protein [Arthrobacter mobilis]